MNSISVPRCPSCVSIRHLLLVCSLIPLLCVSTFLSQAWPADGPGFTNTEKKPYLAHEPQGVVILTPVEDVPIPEPIPVEVLEEVEEAMSPAKEVRRKQSTVREERTVLPPVQEVDWPEPDPIGPEREENTLWGGDIIIGTYPYDHPGVARKPGSSSIFFAVAYDKDAQTIDLYRTTDSWYNWTWLDLWSVSSVVNNPCPDIAVTPDHIFIVYETGGNVYVRKYSHAGNLLATYNAASQSYAEYHPAIATDAERWPSDPWIYVTWTQDDAAPGTEVYFRVWNTTWSPQSASIGIFGAASAYDYDYPDICCDNSSSNRVHVVSWQRDLYEIAYRGATSYGNDPADWGSAFYISGSAYAYRLGRIDAEGNRVLVTWERPDADVYAYYSYSTTGGINSGNFLGPRYFTSKKWRPIPVLINTSSQWYIACWRSDNGYRASRLRTTDPSGSWSILTVSDQAYTSLPWFSFGGTTYGDGNLGVVWADGETHMACDADWVGVEEASSGLKSPASFYLLQNSPNPARSITAIPFGTPRNVHLTVSIYDISGRKVRTLVDRTVSAGHHMARWDGRSDDGQRASPGVYFIRLAAGDSTRTSKMVLLR